MRTHRPAYAALVWLLVFVVTHVVAAVATDPAADAGPWGYRAFLVYDLVLVAIATAGLAVVAATVRPWGRRIPRVLLLVPLWFGAVLLTVRGVPGMVENVAMVTGLAPGGFAGDGPLGAADLVWSLAVNTYFFVGAVVLVPTTLAYQRATRQGTRITGRSA